MLIPGAEEFPMKATKLMLGALTLIAGVSVGCGSIQPFPPGGSSAHGPAVLETVTKGAAYRVQQGELTPGARYSQQRREYCDRWQCAYVTSDNRDWCMRGCITSWDL